MTGIFVLEQSSVLDRTTAIDFGTGESQEENILEVILDILFELELEDGLLQRGDTALGDWFEGDQ
jgi:hypothetical protein